MELSAAAAVAACDAITALVDKGGPGSIVLYAGPVPVARCWLGAEAYGPARAVGGYAVADLTAPATDKRADGTVGLDVDRFVVTNGEGTAIFGGVVGSSADLELNTNVIGSGALVSIASLEVRVPFV